MNGYIGHWCLYAYIKYVTSASVHSTTFLSVLNRHLNQSRILQMDHQEQISIKIQNKNLSKELHNALKNVYKQERH